MTGTDSLLRTVEVLEAGIADGLHIGAQVYVSVHGEPVADFAVGEAQRGVPMELDTLMLWQSCTKPLVAVAWARLWELGLTAPDEPVAAVIREFGNHGKEAITFRHFLTHTAGFRFVMLRWFSQTWQENFDRLCNAELEPGWIPGKKAGYHAASTWFLLGEVVRRLDGRPVEQYVREEIFEPLGMRDSWLAMTPEQYYAYDERIGILHNTEAGPAKPLPLQDDLEGCTICRPGASGRGPIRELGRFYEMLLFHGALGETRIVSPQTVEAMTARHRVGMLDHTFGSVVDWGLGFLVDSKATANDAFSYSFGPYASPRTFGHGGSQSSISFADPERGLVAAVICNGTPGERKHGRRMRAITGAIYEDLGFV